jgi:hypothetical protein
MAGGVFHARPARVRFRSSWPSILVLLSLPLIEIIGKIAF